MIASCLVPFAGWAAGKGFGETGRARDAGWVERGREISPAVVSGESRDKAVVDGMGTGCRPGESDSPMIDPERPVDIAGTRLRRLMTVFFIATGRGTP